MFLGLVFGFCSQLGQGQSASTTLYFLIDDSHQQWCGYTREADYEAKAEHARPDLEGRAVYLNNRLSKLVVFQGSVSGDWSVEDEYTLDKSENIQTFRREIVNLSHDVKEERNFLIRNGKVIKQKTVGHRVYSNDVTTERLEGDYKPIVRKAISFPFWSFLLEHHTKILSTGQACASIDK
jgi:hypothetical protein